MKGLYLDNGATAFPKAPGVVESMSMYLTEIGCNVGRGAYDASYEAENIVFETRELLCQLFNTDQPENVIFTKNITESLNVILKGLLKDGDHVIVSSMEHNAVMRPLHSPLLNGVVVTEVTCSEEGVLNPEDLYAHIKPQTKAVVMLHASNLCGTVMPAEAIGRICKEKGLYFILDTAQTAGLLDIDFKKLNLDALAFTGHKGLLGPQGIGGFIVTDALANAMATLIEGGTGSKSESVYQPDYMPDKFESGTPNLPGIYGLNASLKYLQLKGIANIHAHEMKLTEAFLEGVAEMEHVRVIGKKDMADRMAVVSLDFPDEDNGLVAFKLDKEFGIKTRCGLHCAPNAHKTLGTFPKGTVRFSFGHANTMEEVKVALDAISKCQNI